MHRVQTSIRFQQGFTITELVMVMVILGILAAFAIPRFADRAPFEARGYFDETLSASRYAQKVAIASGCDTRVSISNAAGYSLLQRAACTTGAFTLAVTHPGTGNAFAAAPPAGVAIAPDITFYFDNHGKPRSTATTNLLAAPLATAIGANSLQVEPYTGFVHQP
jgi:MSHA pilin protein MshC